MSLRYRSRHVSTEKLEQIEEQGRWWFLKTKSIACASAIVVLNPCLRMYFRLNRLIGKPRGARRALFRRILAVWKIAAGVADPGWRNIYSKEHLENQVPQYLRLLQQFSILSLGLLDPESFDRSRGSCGRLRVHGLERWLGGEIGIRPELPRTDLAVSIDQLLHKMRRFVN